MKPSLDAFCVVTATCDAARATDAVTSWIDRSTYRWPLVVVESGERAVPLDAEIVPAAAAAHHPLLRTCQREHLGVVPAFALGLSMALSHTQASVIACLHDDVWIDEDGWDARVVEHFSAHPACGLAGFGGAKALGHPQIYQVPYDPMQLARGGFRSNMRDAEAHGSRTTETQRVACLDGFSQIGRRAYWMHVSAGQEEEQLLHNLAQERHVQERNLFGQLAALGVIHHAYDAALGCFAARLGWETWLIPVACHHAGGQTAVAHAPYHAWAATQIEDGDQGFWRQAHEIVYAQFRDTLPLTTKE